MSEENPVRRRRVHRESRGSQFLRNFRFELLWLLVVALGLYLLLEQHSLRQSLTSRARETAREVFQRATTLDGQISAFLAQVSISDLVGFILVLVAVVAILARVRGRLLTAPELTRLRCPRCGGGLYRIHRTRTDRLIGLFVPVRRFRCRADGCHWSGLRVGRGHGASTSTSVGSEA